MNYASLNAIDTANNPRAAFDAACPTLTKCAETAAQRKAQYTPKPYNAKLDLMQRARPMHLRERLVGRPTL